MPTTKAPTRALHSGEIAYGNVGSGMRLDDVNLQKHIVPGRSAATLTNGRERLPSIGDDTLNQTTPLDLADPRTYRRWSTVTIRYADEDRMGHVNNAAYGIWIEVARATLIARYKAAGPDWLDTVLASVTINYLKETSFPGDVRVGARLLRIGNSSFRSGYGVFRDDACLATAECTNVYFDLRTRTSTAPSEAVRKIMEADLATD